MTLMRWKACVVLLSCLAVWGCSLSIDELAQGLRRGPSCRTDRECSPGVCQQGMCVAEHGDISLTILEVVPPPGELGVTYFTPGDLSDAQSHLDLQVARLSQVTGFVRQAAMVREPAKYSELCANQALPDVEVTLTPRWPVAGARRDTYVVKAEELIFANQAGLEGHPCASEIVPGERIYEFSLDLPDWPVPYDIYLRPLPRVEQPGGSSASTMPPLASCDLVPQLFRRQTLATDKPRVCVPLAPPVSQHVAVSIPWPSTAPTGLGGWTGDLVHPETGQILSTRQVFTGALSMASGSPAYALDLQMAQTVGDIGTLPGSELVRLTPPDGVVAPVIQLERAALEALQVDTAVIDGLAPFPPTRDYDVALLKESACAAGQTAACELARVPGRATFIATQLEGIRPGLFASYASPSLDVSTIDGLRASLLPGRYRLHFTPLQGSELALLDETNVEVPATCAPTDYACVEPPLHAPAILVHDAKRVIGSARPVAAAGSVDDATVQLAPSPMYALGCRVEQGVLAECTRGPGRVLDTALGTSLWAPRPAGAVVAGGRFVVDEVDCGECKDGNGAFYDLTIRAPEGSALPWFVEPDVYIVDKDWQMGEVKVPLPVIHSGEVFATDGKHARQPVAGATVRAYVLRDRTRHYVDNPERFAACLGLGDKSTATDTSAFDCSVALLQVAETVADSEGKYELMLPAEIYAPSDTQASSAP